MSRKCRGLAVTGLVLAAAFPAAAYAQDKGSGEYRNARAAPSPYGDRLGPEIRPGEAVAPPAETRLIESIPLAENAQVGLGFFSVVGSTEKEQIRRRTDPALTLRDRGSRVAGAGFSIRF
ncbi:MAG: hypothetical protein ACK40O_04435 [Allosphingosinicella sp.]